ncbi:MAG: hypothetical protein H7240_07740 [Glaciimonas sp.]|nr:hypothetical protein [Glaciimonas sp.]
MVVALACTPGAAVTAATVCAPAAAADWVTVTFVVADVPVAVMAPPVTVLSEPAFSFKFTVIVSTVPPVTLIASPALVLVAVNQLICDDRQCTGRSSRAANADGATRSRTDSVSRYDNI